MKNYAKICEALARKRRRSGKAEQRAARRQASNDRDRARRREPIIATYNMRMMAVDNKHGGGRVVEVLGAYQEMDCRKLGVVASLLFFKLDV